MKLDDSLQLIAEFLPIIGDAKTVIEVGSHRMQDAAWMRVTWPAARIVCFEPDPRSVEWCRGHGVPEKLTAELIPLAVFREAGLFPFHLSTNFSEDPEEMWAQSSSLHRPKEFGGREQLGGNPYVVEPKPIMVQAVTLDGFLPQLGVGDIDLLWIDAQAGEADVLRGAVETLKRTRFLFLEHNTNGEYQDAPTLPELLGLLDGWEILKTLPYDILLKNTSKP